MSDNANNRRKTLVVSVLAFLIAGGGIFLFFIIQGSNDLTSKGKNQNFSYGSAAREGVSSFFKSVGVIPDEEPKLSEAAIDRLSTRELPLEELGIASAKADVADWMAKAPASSASSYSRPATPTSVPRMSASAGSPVGGGGGGSKSAGGVSRFGEGSQSGTTSVSNRGQASATGTTEKGTIGTLRNAKALLGEGLRSGSAMTASSKWNQSFGVGSGSNSGGGKDLAYNKAGLVNLDKIKSGEISNLKMDKKGGLKTPDVGAPEKDVDGTKKALGGDAAVQKAAEEKKKSDEKKEIAKAAIDAAGQGAEKALAGKSVGGPGNDPAGKDENGVPKDIMESINKGTCGQGCTTAGGSQYKDASRVINTNPDGTATCTFSGTQVNPGPPETTIAYSDTVKYDAKGNVMDITVVEKPK